MYKFNLEERNLLENLFNRKYHQDVSSNNLFDIKEEKIQKYFELKSIQLIKVRQLIMKYFVNNEVKVDKKILSEDIKNLQDTYQYFPVWSKIIEIGIYLNTENKGKIRQSIKKLLLLSPFELRTSLQIFNDDLLKKFIKSFTNKINGIESVKEKEMLISYIYNIADENTVVKENFKDYAIWPLNELRNSFGSYNYGIKFIGTWYYLLSKRISENEIFKLLDRKLDSKNVHEIPKEHFWIFYRYNPVDDNIRKIINEKIEKISLSDDLTDLILMDILIENDSIFQFLKNSKIVKIPKLKINYKRKILEQLIYKAESLQYPILELFKLGDRREELLWAMIKEISIKL